MSSCLPQYLSILSLSKMGPRSVLICFKPGQITIKGCTLVGQVGIVCCRSCFSCSLFCFNCHMISRQWSHRFVKELNKRTSLFVVVLAVIIKAQFKHGLNLIRENHFWMLFYLQKLRKRDCKRRHAAFIID